MLGFQLHAAPEGARRRARPLSPKGSLAGAQVDFRDRGLPLTVVLERECTTVKLF